MEKARIGRPVKDEPPFILHQENWPAFQIFLDCATQWRTTESGHVLGLDYSALYAVLKMRGVKKMHKRFNKIKLIERGALEQIRAEKEKS